MLLEATSLEPWQLDLLSWFVQGKRDLPWRRTKDPYAVWMSEIMLQQTQVATVIPYFERWMARFPTVMALAEAPEADVLAYWAGLGYYRRARMLHAGAKAVAMHGVPQNAAEWLRVPGVGRYTAGAIASIAHGEAVALVDGNVERVFARLQGDSRSGSGLTKGAWTWAEEHVVADRPGDWNEALMELGATVCTPRNPKCDACPTSIVCFACAQGRQEELPVRSSKREVIRLHQYVTVSILGAKVGLRQVPPGDWWEGMWQFPRQSELPEATGEPFMVLRHVVTHHRITLDVHLTQASMSGLDWFSTEEALRLALPSPDKRILQRIIAEFDRSP